MTTTTSSATRTEPRRDVAGSVLLAVGGAAFFAGGGLHPRGSDDGDKTAQLHSMLVDGLWYPAHAVLLLGMACFAAAFFAIRQRGLGERMARLVAVVAWIGVAGTVGAVVHLFAATQADEIEDGGTTPLVEAFTGVETLVNPVWGVAVAALAVAGGLTRSVGNRVVLALGLVGGLAYALATATIAFTDALDPLFPVASLLGIWGVAVGVAGLVGRR